MRTANALKLCVVFVVATFAAANGQTFLTNGLVAYYPFNGNSADESGNGNGAVIVGAGLETNRFGLASCAFSFNAVGQYIRTTNSIGFPSSTNDFSVSSWVKLSRLNASDHQMIFANLSLGQFQLSIRPFVGASSMVEFYTGGDSGFNLQSPSLLWSSNQWYNLTLVRSQNLLTLFRDGVPVRQSQTTQGNDAASTNRVLDFGFRKSNSSHQLYGELDDIRIYNRALVTNEVVQLYQYETAVANIARAERALRLDCTNLVVGFLYQIQATADLIAWTNYGPPFVASSTNVSPFVNAGWENGFFRIKRL